ncbi:unnamed protein product [Cylicocyclus nassatus]|uniref:RING-type domain-containing protein n=1 Tax=Cylicocyclus nassatus TaxID=53992 RepID=A0AA36HFW7_CYLNA|nr:unnamed protein product [Cylicocyclus nassatus]
MMFEIRGNCSICSQPYVTNNISALLCGHIFHYDCIVKWFERSQTCPTCRAPTNNNQLVKHLFIDDPSDHNDNSLLYESQPYDVATVSNALPCAEEEVRKLAILSESRIREVLHKFDDLISNLQNAEVLADWNSVSSEVASLQDKNKNGEDAGKLNKPLEIAELLAVEIRFFLHEFDDFLQSKSNRPLKIAELLATEIRFFLHEFDNMVLKSTTSNIPSQSSELLAEWNSLSNENALLKDKIKEMERKLEISERRLQACELYNNIDECFDLRQMIRESDNQLRLLYASEVFTPSFLGILVLLIVRLPGGMGRFICTLACLGQIGAALLLLAVEI